MAKRSEINVQDNIKIIAVDKSVDLSNRLKSIFKASNIKIFRESSLDRVLERFERESFDVLVVTTSSFKAGQTDGIELLEVIAYNSPMTQVLFLAENRDIQTAMSALKAGTYQYAKFPISDEELRLLIETAIEKRPIYGANLLLESEKKEVKFEKLIGRSVPMQNVYQQIRQASATDLPVLLLGETGTGKDLAAQAIHQQSPRNKEPFVIVNLGALPTELVASELFGHEKGSFTGASQQHPGKFEQADKGDIFLDEIDSIDEKVQVGLLRLIEQKVFHRIGGRKAISSSARIISATNQNLLESVQKGTFREDLYYRLDVLRIVMPPLRERRQDISLLIDEFLKRYNLDFHKNILGIAPECIGLLETYDWPGNVRELKNVIQRAVLVCNGEVILPGHLPPRFRSERPAYPIVTFEIGTPLREVEREMIIHALRVSKNNRKKTADLLGISRRALYNKLAKHAIE
jgi:DNA-binding NtrC family response regulator